MSESTRIHPDKLRAYRASEYRIAQGPQAIVLRIGQRSAPLAALFATHGATCGAFITACNPHGTQQSDAANGECNARLAAHLHSLGLLTIEGAGSEPGTDWPAEKSFFVFGLALAPAKAIGRQFEQDAIVWVGPDVVPQLILLR